jgi:hypothetical protein
LLFLFGAGPPRPPGGAEGTPPYWGGWERRVLEVVSAMAGTSVRCVKHRGEEEGGGDKEEEGGNLKECLDSVVACVLIRRQYGGLKGDIAMLNKFASLEKKRRDDVCHSARLCDGIEKRFGVSVGGWVEGSEVVWKNASKLTLDGPIRMTKGNVCEVGVDFHVSSIVEDVVAGGDEEIAKVKGWMWAFESGVNFKRIIDGGKEGGSEEEEEEEGKEEYERVWKDKMMKWRKVYLDRRLR